MKDSSSIGKISVIMPVYNSAATLNDSITSILKQSYSDFEFIIINDGSTDESEKIIKDFSDPRIKYFSNGINKGVVFSLNRGLELASGDYIARMDADDISLPNRFVEQITFLDKNPEYSLVGSARILFNEHGDLSKQRFPTKHDDIVAYSYLANPVIHPTIMFRRSAVVDNHIKYCTKYVHLEDYKFIRDFIELDLKLYNITKPLLKYRISDTQISTNYKDLQASKSKDLRIRLVSRFVEKFFNTPLDMTISPNIFFKLMGVRGMSPADKKILSNIILIEAISLFGGARWKMICLGLVKGKLSLTNLVRFALHILGIRSYTSISIR